MRIHWGYILEAVHTFVPLAITSLLGGWFFYKRWRKEPSRRRATYLRGVGIVFGSWVAALFAMVGITYLVSDVLGLVHDDGPLLVGSGIASFLLGSLLVRFLSGMSWLNAAYHWTVSSLVPILCLGFFTVIFIPSMTIETNTLSWRYSCLTHMDRIAKAITLYSDAHDGQWPPTLTSLADEGLIKPEQLALPSVKRPKREGAWFYLPPADGAAPTSLVASSYTHHFNEPGRCILRADRSVEWLDSSAFTHETHLPINAEFRLALRRAEDEALRNHDADGDGSNR